MKFLVTDENTIIRIENVESLRLLNGIIECYTHKPEDGLIEIQPENIGVIDETEVAEFFNRTRPIGTGDDD